MPGILPMKVIKVGNSSQSRIAQACDRCRSKKIRCDGIRPCCTQCANVGFECKTSDKLSRRAFPRGYTESLEERVRSLETEVKELKNLLDEKDEKIDVLSRIHSFSTSSHQRARVSSQTPPTAETARSDVSDASDAGEEDVIQVPEPSQAIEPVDSQYASISSTHGFIDIFTSRLMEQSLLPSNVSTKALTASSPAISRAPVDQTIKTAPRLVSDQLINIFFQEWAPLYPVVHRPTILKAYERYLSESVQGNTHDMAQLNLIFGIAALASASRTNQDASFFEENWSSALESLSSNISISTLQCFVLAQIYCMAKGDYTSLLRYRGVAIGLCHQLRLHQSQKRFSSNPLVAETRKKVFWCQYVLDRFSAALTGLPVLLREEDIRTEYPEDIDDENVTETDFLPTLPGEFTRISSALALFTASRILNKVLEGLYPSDGGYEIPVSRMRSVAEELNTWEKKLPAHLRLHFSQDKPSTNVTSSRSPLLSLVYYFIRSLIHRPAVCFGDEQIRSPSVLAVSDSSKHIVQILELLDERHLCLSVSVNRKELVSSCGLGLLWQNIGLRRESKLVKESQKLLTTIIDQLEPESAPAAAEFSYLASILVSLDGSKQKTSTKSQDMSPPAHKSLKSPKKQFQALKSRLVGLTQSNQPVESLSRRATISSPSVHFDQDHVRPSSRASRASLPSETYHSPQVSKSKTYYPSTSMRYNHAQTISNSAPSDTAGGFISVADWEFVLGDLDRGGSNIFTGIYGGKDFGDDSGSFASPEYSQKSDQTPVPLTTSKHDLQGLSPEAWSVSSSSEMLPQELAAHGGLGYPDERMRSAEDRLSYHDLQLPLDVPLEGLDPFQGIVIPALEDEIDEYGMISGWDRRLAV